MLYRKRAEEKAAGQRESRIGAPLIQPFERGRVKILWDLNRVCCLGWESADEKRVREECRSEAEEVMGVWTDPDCKQWRGSERALWVWRGTRRVWPRKALSVLGMTASVS